MHASSGTHGSHPPATQAGTQSPPHSWQGVPVTKKVVQSDMYVYKDSGMYQRWLPYMVYQVCSTLVPTHKNLYLSNYTHIMLFTCTHIWPKRWLRIIGHLPAWSTSLMVQGRKWGKGLEGGAHAQSLASVGRTYTHTHTHTHTHTVAADRRAATLVR